jgi:four helix bundle protein
VNIGLGSLAEVEYLLDFAARLGYLDGAECERLMNLRSEAGRVLWKFYKSL